MKKTTLLTPKFLAGIFVFWLSLFFYFVFLAKIYGPYQDDWNNLYFVKALAEGDATLSMLFERFYGAHTPALARVFLSIEYIVFQGSNILPKIIAFGAVVGSMAIFHTNIKRSSLPQADKNLLNITGLLLAFGAGQLYTFNYPWAGLQHPAAILFSLWAIHLFSSDIQNDRNITIPRTLLYLGLCLLSSLFTAIGIFGMAIILVGMILYRAPIKSTLMYLAGFFILFYFLRPGPIIIRATAFTDVVLLTSEAALFQKLNDPDIAFFFAYPRYLFGFTGAILETISRSAAIFIGSILFLVFSIVSIIRLCKPQKAWIFFQLVLYMLIVYALIAAWGRYPSNDNHFDRYAAIYPWLLWSGLVISISVYKKIGVMLCLLICICSLITSPRYIDKQLLMQQESTQADINMVNNSLVHMSYHKISMPLKMFDFKPDFFHAFQKQQGWGIYRHYAIPNLSRIGTDKCEAIKTKQFIVSEKKFVEYQLDGWNLSASHYLSSVYALDSDNNVIAQGASMPRLLRWLPTAWLPREEVMIYLVAPREYPLATLRLIGGNRNNWCEITLIKK